VEKRIAIIQARMSSTRLPGKVLKKVSGKEILGHVLDRVLCCDALDNVVVATSDKEIDEQIVKYVQQYGRGIECFRGEEDDVLDRYYHAAVAFKADWIIRVSSDSPLIDPEVLHSVVIMTVEGGYGYGSNSLIPTMPDGLDIECMRFAVLLKTWSEAALPEEREHVTPYIRMHPELFRMANLRHTEDLSPLCWAVDSEEDYHFVEKLSEHINILDQANYSFEKVVTILKKNPYLSAINDKSVRDYKLLEKLPDIFRHDNDDFDTYIFKRKR
jgi:spore coat polysaccharide biosynthesis protein SpsF